MMTLVYQDQGISGTRGREVRRMPACSLRSTHPARKHHRHSHPYLFALRFSQQVVKFRSHRLPHLGCDGKKLAPAAPAPASMPCTYPSSDGMISKPEYASASIS